MGRRKTRKKKLNSNQLKDSILKYLLKFQRKRLTPGQFIKKLNLENNRDSVQHALDSMMKEGTVRKLADNKYVLDRKNAKRSTTTRQKTKTFQGIVETIRSGAAYVLIDGLDTDVYIPERHLGSAINGDEVEISADFYKGKKPEGKVLKVLKRSTSQIIGKIINYKKFSIVSSTSRKNPVDVYVKPEHVLDAKNGEVVLVDIVDWGDKSNHIIWAKVNRVMSELDDHNLTMESILVENGFSSDYPEKVMQELDKIPNTISEEDLEGRRDFREVLCFTIDPDTAKDFDDAISFEELENGNVEVGVHIADVTHYLKPNTALDKEAYTRSTSVYLVDRCIAMLPEKLSNNLCSLVPHEDRLVFSAVFTFDKKFNIKKEWFGKSVIHSDNRFTYDEGQESIDNPDGLYHRELNIINEIAHKLRKEKFDQGAIAFESDEIKFILDEENKPVDVFVKKRKDVHMLIEDFMLLANKSVAKYLATKNKDNPIPSVYRVHDMPDLDKLADLKLLLEEHDVKLDLSTPDKISESFNILSSKSKEDQKYMLLMNFAIRTMAKAIYTTDNIGHYGLHFEYYTHFTSPIRRYADVLVHRVLYKNLQEEKRENKTQLEGMCIHISKQERRAMEAERDSIKYKKIEYMQQHVGEEFDGIISGMIDKGIFVEVSKSRAEGLIAFNSFDNSIEIEKGRIKAKSQISNKSFNLGDKIRVKIIAADLINRQLEMEIVN